MNIKFVVESDDSYFYPLPQYLVIYEDDSYTLCEGDNLKCVMGKENPHIKEQFPKKEDIVGFFDCQPEYTKLFQDVIAANRDKNRTLANKINNKLKIKHNYQSIYWFKQGTKEYNDVIKNIKQVLTVFRRKCFLSGIKYEKDENKMIKNITEMIDAKVEPKLPDLRNNVSFCYSINAVKKEYEKDVANIKAVEDIGRIEHKFQKASEDMVLYTGEFLGLTDRATIALGSKDPADKELIKKYTEFLIVFPKYVSIMSYLDSCVSNLQQMKQEFRNDLFGKNQEFMEKIDDMIEHDENTDSYFYHVAKNRIDADRIVNEGLYMYSDDLLSTTYEGLSRDELLEHGYGNQYNNYDDYIIVIDKPKDASITRKLSEEEREIAKVMTRRLGLTSKPTHIIDSDYIVGYIDKKNMNVVFNSNYKKNAR